jgi:Ca2+-transporting ATPase
MFYDESLKDVYLRLNSGEKGLSTQEINIRLKEHGYNELVKRNKHTALNIFFNQFKNFLIILLICAALISLFIGEHLEFYGILVIVILTIIMGFIQEYRAEKAMEALKSISAPYAKVLRDMTEVKIPARELVQGDVVILAEGDIVPADMRLIKVESFEIDESSLTGESLPSEKVAIQLKSQLSVADRNNMSFCGTIVTRGDAVGIVTATGLETEFGKVASSIEEIEDTSTPLQVKFERMARQLTYIVLGLVATVFVISIFTVDKTNVEWGKFIGGLFIFSLSLAVAAVPTALPAIVTISLSRGAKRLAGKNMIIKKLPAAESLGSVTVICSDKTGTLTKNQMTITKLFADNKIIDVTGDGYAPSGEFFANGKKLDAKEQRRQELLFRIGYLCNDSKLVNNASDNTGSAAYSTVDHWSIIGDPTEGSLITLAKKSGLEEKYFEENFNKIQELPFDSNRKIMSVIYENYINKKTEGYAKGAPDFILKLCTKIIINGKVRTMTKKDRDIILKQNNIFAEDSLRVLGLAYKDVTKTKKYDISNIEKDMTFVGLAGMIDPPRDGVKEAIHQCDNAGIRVMMITGDHPATAKAIGRRIELLHDGDIVLTGQELDALSDFELEREIENIRIIARALPIQKTRIVEMLQKKGHIVAMTGDGVNDAPALKKADIGIAMGISGTDVSKEVAKAILTDDNFTTIVNAIAEGRTIYDKIVKSTKYLLACNVGEIIAVFFAILAGLPLPLITLQLLLMNLLTDGLPALGLGAENAEDDVMKRMPRNPDDNPLTKQMLWLIAIFGIAMGLGTLFVFSLYVHKDLQLARTMAFTTLVMFEMFAVMSARSFASFKKMSPFSNKWLSLAIIASVSIQLLVIYVPFLQVMFGTLPLGLNDWLIILGVAVFGFILMEVSKLFVREKYKFRSAKNIPS